MAHGSADYSVRLNIPLYVYEESTGDAALEITDQGECLLTPLRGASFGLLVSARHMTTGYPFYVESNIGYHVFAVDCNGNIFVTPDSVPGYALQIQPFSGVTSGFLVVLSSTGTQELELDAAGNLTVHGDVRASLQLISTVAIGTPPLAVTSTTEVVNLNADRVGGTEITNAAAVDQVLVGTGAGTAAWSASTSGLGYTLTLLTSSTGTSPADTTTYYVGTVPFRPADTTYSVVSGIIPKSGTLKRVFLRIRVNTAVGSAEDVNHYIRLNDTTDVNIGTAKYSVAAVVPLDAVVSQAVSAGDTVVLKIVTPAWVTNPTGVFWYAVLYIE